MENTKPPKSTRLRKTGNVFAGLTLLLGIGGFGFALIVGGKSGSWGSFFAIIGYAWTLAIVTIIMAIIFWKAARRAYVKSGRNPLEDVHAATSGTLGVMGDVASGMLDRMTDNDKPKDSR